VEIDLPGYRSGSRLAPSQSVFADGRIELQHLSWLDAIVPQLAGLQGRLDGSFELRGSVERPILTTVVELGDGRFEVPAAGLVLEDLSLRASASPGSPVEVEARSRVGPGHLEVSATVPLRPTDERPARATLRGDRALLWETPGIKILASPDLQLNSDGRELRLEGEIGVPEAAIDLDRHQGGAIRPSNDVEVVAASPPPRPSSPAISSRVRVKLGDDVSLRSQGLEAELTGAVTVTDEPSRAARAVGNLELHGGTLRAYGQTLVIDNGRLIYAGGPVDNPGLTLRASRRARDGTVAGISASGTVREPVVTLWSEPRLSEAEALAYLLLGRPLGQASSSEGELLAGAAASLGLKGGNLLAKRLGVRFGLDEVGVESRGGLEEAALFLGKHLSPRLYVAYGVGFFSALNSFRLRFLLSPSWTLEAESGLESGGDLMYTAESDRGAAHRD
jgi:translocation and assembly module TamB